MKNYMILWVWVLWVCSCQSKLENPQPYILEYPFYFGKPHLPQDNPLTQEGVGLGRKLFFLNDLSSNQQVSCASCHKPEYNFGDHVDFSIGVSGQKTAFNVPHLVNLAWNSGPFGWNGRSKTIRAAIENAILSEKEMNGNFKIIVQRIHKNPSLEKAFAAAFPFTTEPINQENILKALEQYVLSLVSYKSNYDLWQEGKYQPTDSEKRGFELFFKSPKVGIQKGAGCGDCHTGHITTNGRFINNGLFPIEEGLMSNSSVIYDKGKFKVPSLRNVALSAPYMHNAIFSSLEEVIEHYNSGVHVSEFTDPILLFQQNELGQAPNLSLTNQEKQDLLSFLKMLTDSTILNK